jgi:hypothetical protein
MQRKEWLYEDSLTRAPLPFTPHQTQLELLGFLLSGDFRTPQAAEIMAQSGGRRYILAYDGSPREWRHYPRDEVRMPDVPSAGGTICVGDCAYSLGDGRVIFGPPWSVRRQLKRLLPKLTPVQALAVDHYITAQAQAVLRARSYLREAGPSIALAKISVKPEPITSSLPAPAMKVAAPQL